MTIEKIFDLKNDGLDMAAKESILFVRGKRSMYKLSLQDSSVLAENIIFKKDGKARSFSICEKYIYLIDFCDLYILEEQSLKLLEIMHLGSDLSTDLLAVRFDEKKAYISVRNGEMICMDLETREYNRFTISDVSFWNHCIYKKRLYVGTVSGNVLELDTSNMQLLRIKELGRKNIYNVLREENVIYTISQDMTIKAIDVENFEVINIAKKAVKGMTRIIGIYKNLLVVADGGISLWDKETLALQERLAFPTGHFNKGVILHGDMLIGSDYESIYTMKLEE